MIYKVLFFLLFLIRITFAYQNYNFFKRSYLNGFYVVFRQFYLHKLGIVRRNNKLLPFSISLTKATEFSESSEAQAEKRFRTESSQVYGIASYDALFKYVLSDNNVRPSFFHAFVPKLEIQSSERLDEYMSPLETFQLLRDFLHKKDHNTHIKLLAQSDFKVVSSDELGNERDDVPATQIMKEFVGRFEELKLAFPKPHYSGTMDFVCQLQNGDYAMIEMQVIPQNYWDRRALAYVAAFYGNQLKKGGDWKDIRRVIGINILGGSKGSKVHRENTSNQFMRHYKVQEQLHQPAQFIDGIELLQYSIMNSPEALSSQEVQDWVTFFKRGHFMSEEEVVSTIKTPEVLQAFERAKISKLPGEVRLAYEEEDREYDRYSQHTENLVDKGRTEGREEEKRAIALNLMTMTTLSDLEIAQGTGLSETGVQLLRNKKK